MEINYTRHLSFFGKAYKQLSSLEVLSAFLFMCCLIQIPNIALSQNQPTIIGNFSVCSNSTESYLTEQNMQDYEWHIEGGTIINGSTNTYNIQVLWGENGAGLLRVTYTIPFNGNTLSSEDYPVKINTTPDRPSPYSNNWPSSPCAGSIVTYSVNPVENVTYTWTFPEGWIPVEPKNSSSVTVTVGTNDGSVSVTPTLGECDGESYQSDVTVSLPPPQPTPISFPQSPCIGSTVTYSVSEVLDVTYTWTFPEGWIPIEPKNSSSVTVTVGTNNGSVSVTPTLGECDGESYTSFVTVSQTPVEPTPDDWPESPCIGSTVTYSVIEVLDVAYTWTFPEGWIPIEPYNSSSVKVTVEKNDGSVSVTPTLGECDGESYTSFVTVSQTPVEPTPDDWPESPCIGSTVTYSVIEVLDVTYTWTFPEGWIPIEPYNSSSVKVTVGTNDGSVSVTPTLVECDGESYQSDVTVSLPPPQPTPISFPQSPIAGDTISYSVQNITGVTFHWEVPDSWEIVGGQDSHILTVRVGANEGNVSVYAANDCGNGDKYELQIAPRILQASIEAHMNKLTYCVNERVNITSSIAGSNSSDYFTYKWFFNDIEQNSYTDRLEFNASESGIIKLLINGFLYSNSISITVNPLPNLNLANDYASYCKNQKGVLLHVTEPDPELTYTWTPGEGIDAWSDITKTYLIVNFATDLNSIPAHASVKAKNTYGCEATKTFATQLYSISETLPDTLQWKKKGDHILVFNPESLLKGKSWDWGYTSLLSDFDTTKFKEADTLNYCDFHPNFISNSNTLYWVEVISSAKDACNARYYYNVPMQFKYSLPEETPEHPLKVFPNPATGLIYLDPGPVENSEGELQYQVYDMRGTLLKSGKLNPHPGSPVLIDLSAFPSGLYLLRVFNNKGFTGNSRIIIAK